VILHLHYTGGGNITIDINTSNLSTQPAKSYQTDERITVEKRGRCWVFTLNGLDIPWADWNLSNIFDFIESLSKLAHVRYICGGVESGTDTNRLHFQGYVEFTKSVRFTAVGHMLDSRFKILKNPELVENSKRKKRKNLAKGYTYSPDNSSHNLTYIDRKKGTREQARDYALKTGLYEEENTTQILSPVQFGKWVENGTRLDLEDLANDILQGKSDLQIFERDSVAFMRHIRMIRETRTMLLSSDVMTKYRQVEVCYISGESRTGKTTLITNHFGYENVYRITDKNNPWDGYNNQPIVIFEEFRQSYDLDLMLAWLEGHPIELPARYYNRPAAFTKVFIISNWDWETQYQHERENKPNDYQALINRIHHVIKFYKENDTIIIRQNSNSSLNNIFYHNGRYPKILLDSGLID
jgi:hypothetical protein